MCDSIDICQKNCFFKTAPDQDLCGYQILVVISQSSSFLCIHSIFIVNHTLLLKIYYYKIYINFFQSSFRSQKNWERKLQRFPYTPSSPKRSFPHDQHHSPEYCICYQGWASQDMSCPPESTVCIRAHSWCCTFCGFEYTYNDMCNSGERKPRDKYL